MTLNDKIGEGAFGNVFRGFVSRDIFKKLPYQKLHGQSVIKREKGKLVAVKLLKGKETVFPIVQNMQLRFVHIIFPILIKGLIILRSQKTCLF